MNENDYYFHVFACWDWAVAGKYDCCAWSHSVCRIISVCISISSMSWQLECTPIALTEKKLMYTVWLMTTEVLASHWICWSCGDTKHFRAHVKGRNNKWNVFEDLADTHKTNSKIMEIFNLVLLLLINNFKRYVQK